MASTTTKYTVGFLVLAVLLSGVVYVTLPSKVKLRIDNDKSTFYVYENSRFVVSGREYNKLFDGSKQLYRRTSGITIEQVINGDKITVTRTTPYIRGPIIIDTYQFDGSTDDVKRVPVSHEVTVLNATGYFYRYEVRDLVYNGPTYKLTGETVLNFGRNMKLYLNPMYRWAWLYKSGIVRVQYDIPTDNEHYNLRLFDPVVTCLFNDKGNMSAYEYETIVEVNCSESTNITVDTNVANFTVQAETPFNYSLDTLRQNLFFEGTFNKTWQVSSGSIFYPDPLQRNCSVGWSEVWPCENIIDEFTDTYGIRVGLFTNATLHANFSTFGDNVTYIVLVKDGSDLISHQLHVEDGVNCSINDSVMQFKVDSVLNTTHTPNWNQVNWQCWNNSRWNTFRLSNGSANAFARAYRLKFFTVGDTGLVKVDDRTDIVNVTVRLTGNSVPNASAGYTFAPIASSSSTGSWADFSQAVDGNYGTASDCSSGTCLGYVNFSITGTSCLGQVRTGVVWQNYTMPVKCSTMDPVQLRYVSVAPDTEEFGCWDGTTYAAMHSTSTAGGGNFYDSNVYCLTDFYPVDASVEVNDNQRISLLGELIGTKLLQDKFSYLSDNADNVNVTFPSAGIKTVSINMSASAALLPANTLDGNVTFSYSGFEVDDGNDLDLTERFNDSARTNILNTSFTSPEYVYDNFENSTASLARWDQGGTCSTCIYNVTGGNNDDTYRLYLGNVGKNQYITSPSGFTLQNRSRITVNLSTRTILSTTGGCSFNDYATNTLYLQIHDGVNTVNTYSISRSSQGSTVDATTVTNVSVINSPGTDDWSVYDNGIFTKVVSTSSLDKSNVWQLRFFQDIIQSPNCGLTAASIETNLREVKMSGLGLNITGSDTVRVNGTFMSELLFTAPSNVSAATLIPTAITPSGTAVTYELSNDNGGNFTVTTTGQRLAFDSVGNQMRVRINLTTTDVYETPVVEKYNLIIVPGTASGIEIDVTGNGQTDCSFAGKLNESTSPQNCSVESSLLHSYLRTNSVGKETELLPIAVSINSSGGTVQFHNLNVTQDMTTTVINQSVIEDAELTNINVQITSGELLIDDLRFDFAGSKNVSFDTGQSDNYRLRVYYSKFNITFGPNVSYWEVFPSSRNESRVEPYGQTDTIPIFNVENFAYDEPINVYARYNETLDACTNTSFEGTNDTRDRALNITLNTTNQYVAYNLSVGVNGSIWSYTNVSCVGVSDQFFIPYFCFNSLCSNCTITSDFQDKCEQEA